MGALAAGLGRDLLAIEMPDAAEPAHQRLIGPWCTLTGAMPVLSYELGPGETIDVPSLPGYVGPVGLCLGDEGGVSARAADAVLSLSLPTPDHALRQRYWAEMMDGREAIRDNDYRGIEIEVDEIFVSDGSKQDSGNIQEIFGADCKVLVTDPSYPVYVDTNVMAGRSGDADEAGNYAGIHYLPATEENGFVPGPPTEVADLVYLCSPNNPTGSVASRDNLSEWVAYAKQHRAVIPKAVSLGEDRAFAVERLDDVPVAFPARDPLRDDGTHVDRTFLTEVVFLDDRAIETDEQPVRRLRDLQDVSRFQEHVHQAAFGFARRRLV